MSTVTVHEAKTHLSRLIKEALAGEEVLIAPRGGEPVVRLVKVEPSATLPRRTLGGLEHTVPPGVADPLAEGFWEPIAEDDIAFWVGTRD